MNDQRREDAELDLLLEAEDRAPRCEVQGCPWFHFRSVIGPHGLWFRVCAHHYLDLTAGKQLVLT